MKKKTKDTPAPKRTLGIVLSNGQRIIYTPGVVSDEGQPNERVVTNINETPEFFVISIKFKDGEMQANLQKSQILGWDWLTPNG